MVEVDKTRILKVAFALLVLGNSQVFMRWGLDRITLYLGLGLILGASLLIFFNQGWNKINKTGIGIALCVCILMSMGIIVQELALNKKIILIISILILTLLATLSKYIVSSYKCIYACSIGILYGIIITCIISLLLPGVNIFQKNIADIGLTCGMEHKNYFGVAAMSVFIGVYLYYSNVIKKKIDVIIMVICVALIILSSSRGAMLLTFIFLIVVNLYKFIDKFNITVKAFFSIAVLVMIGLIFMYLTKISNFNYRVQGLFSTFKFFSRDAKDFFFGISDIAYRDGNYVNNVREYLNWQGTTEMAVVAIMVKGGFLAVVGNSILFVFYFKSALKCKDKRIKYSILSVCITFLLSSLIETYIMNVNLVYCAFSYCVLAGLGNFQIKESD